MSPSTCHIKNLDVCYTVQSRGNMQSKDSTTPLIEAVVSNNEKVVSDLLKHGASVNFPNVSSLLDLSAHFLQMQKEKNQNKISDFASIINYEERRTVRDVLSCSFSCNVTKRCSFCNTKLVTFLKHD